MSNLLEITGDDIAKLTDTDLRALIGQLCEADYRAANLPTKGITWGGNQDAKDGGLDVVVRDEVSPPANSFIARSITGFQVKKPDMPKSEILKEMKPKGVLRDEIKALIKDGGSYVIISSTGSTSEKALQDRIKAMREAVANEENNKNLHLEFLDRGRVATWVRCHPASILWVRNRIRQELKGWRPYENWANSPGGVEEEYIIDKGLRLHDGTITSEDGMSIEKGISQLRSAINTPGTSTRLAGLSGVGKTRLVQALFDSRIGDGYLNPYQAFYTDISDSPDPDPKTFAEQLIASQTRAILVVDNCPPELHSRLTETCSQLRSTVSLITVEYDVRDHIPDETSVFRLEPASDSLIEKIIIKRFPHVNEIDARTIADNAGGNARVAIALANTLKKGETLSGLRNDELFERLFHQRNDKDEKLLRSAEVFSLVYSFEGTDTNSEESELNFLAKIIDKKGAYLYRDIKTLQDRELIQSRGAWRAMLPHAIANKMAKRALESTPKSEIVKAFLESGSERLIKSFTRRLSYLHDCDIAVEIVNEWLSKDGWVGKSVSDLSEFGMEIFRNISPVSPEKALEAIELAANGTEGDNFTSKENKNRREFARLLRHLAYDSQLFIRSARILCQYALSEEPGENVNSTRELLKSLFYIYLSGTHASIDDRASIIQELVNAEEEKKQELGMFLLDAALETWHFSSSHEFSFGVRPRDYGYTPKTREDVINWYKPFIDICTRLSLSDKPIAIQARRILSSNLRGLWTKGGMVEEIFNSACQIHKQNPWNEGWLSVRSIIRYDIKELSKDTLNKLYELEALLKPNDLLEKARTVAVSDQNNIFDLEDDFDEDEKPSDIHKRVEKTTRKIGSQVAQDHSVLNLLFPDIFYSSTTRIHSFGRGLAEGCSDKQELWDILFSQFKKASPQKRRIGILLAFLSFCADSDPAFYNNILDQVLEDDVLGEVFPMFQTTSNIDGIGLKRLHKALDAGKANISYFEHIAWGRVHESINDDDLADLLNKILSKEGGINVVIEILNMRFHRGKGEFPPHSRNLMQLARNLISAYQFTKECRDISSLDHDLSFISEVCMKGKDGEESAVKTCGNLLDAIVDNRIYAFNYSQLLNSLAKNQPEAFLNTFLGNKKLKNSQHRRIFSLQLDRHENPINQIADGVLIRWCDINPEKRYPLTASALQTFSGSEEIGELTWKPIVYSILDNAPNLEPVLKHLADSLQPMSWSGSLADILQKRLPLLSDLFDHKNAEIGAWARSQYLSLQNEIQREQDWEKNRSRERNESFE